MLGLKLGLLMRLALVTAIAAKSHDCRFAGNSLSGPLGPNYTSVETYTKKTSDADNADSANVSRKSGTETGKKVFVHSKTMFLKASTLEAAFRKHKEFLDSGFIFTKVESDADVVIEIDRAPFTTEFPYSIIDSRSLVVIGSGKVNSIGGTVAGKISSGFIKELPGINAAIQK